MCLFLLIVLFHWFGYSVVSTGSQIIQSCGRAPLAFVFYVLNLNICSLPILNHSLRLFVCSRFALLGLCFFLHWFIIESLMRRTLPPSSEEGIALFSWDVFWSLNIPLECTISWQSPGLLSLWLLSLCCLVLSWLVPLFENFPYGSFRPSSFLLRLASFKSFAANRLEWESFS